MLWFVTSQKLINILSYWNAGSHCSFLHHYNIWDRKDSTFNEEWYKWTSRQRVYLIHHAPIIHTFTCRKADFIVDGNFCLLTRSGNIIPYWPCEKPVIKGALESRYFMSVACLPLRHELFLQVCHCLLSVCNGKKAWTLVHWNEVTLQGGGKHLSINFFFVRCLKRKGREFKWVLEKQVVISWQHIPLLS